MHPGASAFTALNAFNTLTTQKTQLFIPIMHIKSLLALLLLLPLSLTAQTIQKGFVKEYNEKANKTPLSGVEVRAKSAQNTVSEKDGSFQLKFLTLNPGNKVNISRIEKLGYEIFNKEAVEQWNINPESPFVIVMCRSDKLKKLRDIYESKASANYEKQYKKNLAYLKKLKAEGKIKEEEYRKSLEEINATYTKQLENLDNYIDRFSRIDLSEISNTEQEIIELMQQGRFDEAIAKYEEQNYKDKYLQQLSEINEISSAIDQLSDIKNTKLQAKDSLLAAVTRQIETLQLVGGKENNQKIRKLYVEIADADTTNVEWLLKTGIFLSVFIADYNLALNYYNKALYSAIDKYGTEHPDVAKLYNNIGSVYSQMGDYGKAMEYYQKALKMQEYLLGSEHPDVARYYNNIGNTYMYMGDYTKALEYLQKALIMSEKLLGAKHLGVASAYNNIGSVYWKKGDYTKALDYYQKALIIKENLLGTEHPDVAVSYSNLGYVYDNQKEYDKAIDYYIKALAIKEKFMGQDHKDVKALCKTIIKLYDKLAIDYISKQEYGNALEYFLKELEMKEKIYPNDHIEIAETCNWVGSCYNILSDFSNSIIYHTRALEIYEKKNGPEDTEVANSNYYIGDTYLLKREYQTALDYLQKALSVYEKTYDIKYLNICMVFSDIYRCLTALGKEEAKYSQMIDEFMSDKTWIMTVRDEESPATQIGLSNEYYILEFNDWNTFNGENLFEIVESSNAQGIPVDIVIMKDDTISKHHFEDEIGVNINISKIGSDELEKINNLYQFWKSSQN